MAYPYFQSCLLLAVLPGILLASFLDSIGVFEKPEMRFFKKTTKFNFSKISKINNSDISLEHFALQIQSEMNSEGNVYVGYPSVLTGSMDISKVNINGYLIYCLFEQGIMALLGSCDSRNRPSDQQTI